MYNLNEHNEDKLLRILADSRNAPELDKASRQRYLNAMLSETNNRILHIESVSLLIALHTKEYITADLKQILAFNSMTHLGDKAPHELDIFGAILSATVTAKGYAKVKSFSMEPFLPAK